MNDSERYLNSLNTQLSYLTDKNVDQVFEYIDDEFETWQITINTTLKDTIKHSKMDEIIEYANFTLTVLEDFFKTKKNELVNILEQISNDIESIQTTVNHIDADVKKVSADPRCQSNSGCRDTTSKITNTLVDINSAIDRYDVINDTINTIREISDDSQISQLKNWTSTNAENELHELMNSNVFQRIQEYRDKTKKMSSTIKDMFKPYVSTMGNFTEGVFSADGRVRKTGTKYLTEFVSNYSTLVYTVTLVVALILAIVLLLACLGLMFGMHFILFYLKFFCFIHNVIFYSKP